MAASRKVSLVSLALLALLASSAHGVYERQDDTYGTITKYDVLEDVVISEDGADTLTLSFRWGETTHIFPSHRPTYEFPAGGTTVSVYDEQGMLETYQITEINAWVGFDSDGGQVRFSLMETTSGQQTVRGHYHPSCGGELAMFGPSEGIKT